MSDPVWIDSHCHLDPEADVDAVLSAAGDAGVVGVVTVGTDVASSIAAADLASGRSNVWATAGVHPHDAKDHDSSDSLDALERLALDGVVVAIGECGLDYHYDHSPRDIQRRVFAAQVALANRCGLPLVIHTRDAWDDTFDVLAAEGVPERVVVHCFTGGPDEARRALDLGAHLSFSGIVSFPGAPEVREAAALCPSDRFLVETDSPYLAPVPMRGRPNQPAWVCLVGEAVAEARGETPEAVAEMTTATTRRVFGLPAVP